MEVTDSEKSALVESDSEWAEPSAELTRQAEDLGARYNRNTGFFELNTLVDITEQQMRDIISYTSKVDSFYGGWVYSCVRCRTNIYPPAFTQITGQTGFYLCLSASFEVFSLGSGIHFNDCTRMFDGCKKLRKCIGKIMFAPNFLRSTLEITFRGCSSLESVNIYGLPASISFADSPLLSLASLAYMVENSSNTSAITITLHPDAYARLTDELIEQAAEKQITFITTITTE